ncbi:Coiled-coil domain-containing protein 14 [Heterocephalus glaber]|uniref:Coiled-coil domain-containing protein 14 n=1 Tax=Heterocephalus glaber TaxID=10181 RepID=G5AV88_HETGA|nr:Coiled-coil domain-containing protein 14 [Heterocephalus glaber]
MRREVGRAPSRKRKLGGRAGGGWESVAVNSFCSAVSLSSFWTETIQGLDGCAALLRDILRNEDSGSEAVYSENRCNSRSLEDKKCGSKKKGYEKHTVPSVIRKEILSLDNKKQIPSEVSAESERDTSDTAQNWSLQDHYRMYSPIIYQALCEHVQTQMSLMNNLASKNGPNRIPSVPYHTVSDSESQATLHSNYCCCTSTPVWSPQQPLCPPMVHSEVQTDGGNQFASQGKTMSVNYPDVPRSSFNASPGVACGLPQTDKAAVSTSQQLSLANWILPQQGVCKEADLQKCLQTCMSLFQSLGKETLPDIKTHQSPTQLQPAFSASNEETCAREQIAEATNEGKCLNVQDAKIVQDTQKAKNVNQTAEKVKTIKYLLRELKALVAEQEDSEIQRLVTEVEACITGLLAVSGNIDIQVEIALAMQPLRSENAQLRRTLQNSMAKLLSDLSVDTTRCKPGNNLTKSLLHTYDKQLQQDPTPPHTSVMNYLNKLETNHSFTHSEPLSAVKDEETINANRPCENVLPSRGPPHGDSRAVEGVSAPEILPDFSQQGSDVECESITLMEDSCSLDNTIYIPFARSSSKKNSPLSKRISPKPQVSVAATQLVSNSALTRETESKLCSPVICLNNEAKDISEKLSRTGDAEDKQLLKKIKEAIHKIPAATKEPEEQAYHGPSVCHTTNVQAKGNTVCDGSFLNSDLMSDWSISSFSTFTSRDEQDFRNGLAALDANIARLQKSLRTGLLEK